ncbi:MAG: hypothetical protein QXH30_02995, partial [Candidatus Bilamarchaeaceae archaeon]
RKLGGVEFIRRLPLEDRLKVMVEIGFELGREMPAKRCASRLFSLIGRKAEAEQLSEIAIHYGLDFEFSRALHFAREGDSTLDYLLRMADGAWAVGDRHGVRQWASTAIRNQLSLGNHNTAKCISRHYGLPDSELRKIASRLFKAEMGKESYDSAEAIASTFKLPGERRKARITSVLSDISKGKFASAEKKAAKWGLGHKFIRRAAVSIWGDLMAEGQFLQAIRLAEWARLFAEREKAALAEFSRLKRGKENFKAAQHAKRYGLVPQMHAAGGKVVRADLKDGQEEAAIQHAKEFGLNKLAQKIGRKLISALAKKNDFFSAARIAAECGDENARKELLLNAVRFEMEQNSKFRAFSIALSSGLEKEAKEIAWGVFLNSVSAGNYSRARTFAEKAHLEEALQILKELERIIGLRASRA